jgi:hypothetical protein
MPFTALLVKDEALLVIEAAKQESSHRKAVCLYHSPLELLARISHAEFRFSCKPRKCFPAIAGQAVSRMSYAEIFGDAERLLYAGWDQNLRRRGLVERL